MFNLILKAVGSLTVLFLLTKFLGKKQIAQLNMYDYIISISIGNIVADMSGDKGISFLHGVVVLVTYAVVSYLLTYVTTKSIVFRRFMTGIPIVLIENGKIIEDAMNDARIDINDLLEEARINGYFDLSEVLYAVMESSGRISFLLKSEFNPVTPSDSNMKVDYKGIIANVIIDGNIMNNNLKYVGKNEGWLKKELKKMNCEASDILLAISDKFGKLTVYPKDVKSKESNCLE